MKPRTSLRNTNDITILQPDRNSLPLDGRRLLVPNLVNTCENGFGYVRFAPGAKGVGDVTT